jgi:hypothetical protein
LERLQQARLLYVLGTGYEKSFSQTKKSGLRQNNHIILERLQQATSTLIILYLVAPAMRKASHRPKNLVFVRIITYIIWERL